MSKLITEKLGQKSLFERDKETQPFDQYEFDERAAIYEFDAGHTRIEAEHLALFELTELYKKKGKTWNMTKPAR